MTTATTEKNLSEMTMTELRSEFAYLMRNSGQSAMRSEWLAEVEKVAVKLAGNDSPEPMEYVEAARIATTKCDKCGGRGEYYWGGSTNGKPKHTGVCFRCEGKGRQNQDDFKRNYGHDLYSISNAYRAMISE